MPKIDLVTALRARSGDDLARAAADEIERLHGAAKHPVQPLVKDSHDGVLRFKKNAIVRHLLDFSTPRGMGMNEIACLDFSVEDRQQFAQLIGYSLGGYGELEYVNDEAYDLAARGVARQCTPATLKRYLAFTGDECYPARCMGDFIGDFETEQEAIDAALARRPGLPAAQWHLVGAWAAVWDSQPRCSVWST